MRVEHETAYASTGNHHVTLSDLPKLLREPIKIGHIFIYFENNDFQKKL